MQSYHESSSSSLYSRYSPAEAIYTKGWWLWSFYCGLEYGSVNMSGMFRCWAVATQTVFTSHCLVPSEPSKLLLGSEHPMWNPFGEWMMAFSTLAVNRTASWCNSVQLAINITQHLSHEEMASLWKPSKESGEGWSWLCRLKRPLLSAAL